MVSERENELAKAIEQELYEHIGPLLFGEKLYAALGFSSYQAFRQASSRNTLPVEIFTLEKRRGKFALSRDVAKWLAKKRYQRLKETEQETMKKA